MVLMPDNKFWFCPTPYNSNLQLSQKQLKSPPLNCIFSQFHDKNIVSIQFKYISWGLSQPPVIYRCPCVPVLYILLISCGTAIYLVLLAELIWETL